MAAVTETASGVRISTGFVESERERNRIVFVLHLR